RSLSEGNATCPTKRRRMLAWPAVSRVPAPRPIASMVMAGSAPNRSATVVKIAAPVGVVISISTVDSSSGTPFSHSARPGPGQGPTPVCRLARTEARGDRTCLKSFDTEQIKADRRAADVDDRIDGAHFVKMDLL